MDYLLINSLNISKRRVTISVSEAVAFNPYSFSTSMSSSLCASRKSVYAKSKLSP